MKKKAKHQRRISVRLLVKSSDSAFTNVVDEMIERRTRRDLPNLIFEGVRQADIILDSEGHRANEYDLNMVRALIEELIAGRTIAQIIEHRRRALAEGAQSWLDGRMDETAA